MAYADLFDDFGNKVPGGGISGGETVSMPTAPSAPQLINNRESYHWDRIPDAYRNVPGITGWANDPNVDPGAKVQEYLASLKSQGLTDAGDAAALTGTGYAGGKAPKSSSQSVAAPAPAFQLPTNTAPQFDDPSSRLVEDYSLGRMQHLQNPAPQSGTAGFEQYAKQLIETLKGPVYSAGDEAVIKTKATDAIFKERDQTRQRWMEEISRRGIAPSSGIALDGIRKIDEHFEGLRTTVEADFARSAIDQTRNQRFQVLDTYGKLANSEEGRMREAGTYASMPLELQNQAFQRNMQLVGAGGSPQSVLSSLMQLSSQNYNQNYLDSQRKAATVEALMEYLGSLGY